MSLCLLCEEETNRQMTWRQFFKLVEPPLLCGKCLQPFERITGECCRLCSRPLAALDASFIVDGVCRDCVRWEKESLYKGVLSGNVSLYTYNEAMKAFIARFKYRGDYLLAKAFAEEVRQAARKIPHDMVVPVPLSEERLHERGFNQAEALAREAGMKPVNVLERSHAEKQSKKSREERLRGAQVFRLKENSSVHRKTILLTDDIYTTGATVRHTAYVLKQAGAAGVTSLTLARGQGREREAVLEE